MKLLPVLLSSLLSIHQGGAIANIFGDWSKDLFNFNPWLLFVSPLMIVYCSSFYSDSPRELRSFLFPTSSILKFSKMWSHVNLKVKDLTPCRVYAFCKVLFSSYFDRRLYYTIDFLVISCLVTYYSSPDYDHWKEEPLRISRWMDDRYSTHSLGYLSPGHFTLLIYWWSSFELWQAQWSSCLPY